MLARSPSRAVGALAVAGGVGVVGVLLFSVAAIGAGPTLHTATATPGQTPVTSTTAAPPDPVTRTGRPPPSSSAAAAQDAAEPVVSASTASSPIGPVTADAPRQGPRRSRGLPIVLAFVVLVGVAGAVARAAARTVTWPRRIP